MFETQMPYQIVRLCSYFANVSRSLQVGPAVFSGISGLLAQAFAFSVEGTKLLFL